MAEHRLYNQYSKGSPNAGLETDALLGEFVKSIDADGNVVVQLTDNTESNVTLPIHDSSSGFATADHRRIQKLEQLTSEISLRVHDGWAASSDVAVSAIKIVPSTTSLSSSTIVNAPWGLSVTQASNDTIWVLVRLRVDIDINSIRVIQLASDNTTVKATIHGVFISEVTQGGFAYYAANVYHTAVTGDIFRVESSSETQHLVWEGDVDEVDTLQTEVDNHEADWDAHQDSPRRVTHLGVASPVGRDVYLTQSVPHPGSEHIFSVPISQLGGFFLGASVVDFSNDDGPEAASSTAGYPAVFTTNRIAAIWQTGSESQIRIAVANIGGSFDLTPTILHTEGSGVDHRISLTEDSQVTVGGIQYRIMLGTSYTPDLLQTIQTSGGSLSFALGFATGFLKADGNIDTGTTLGEGHYLSQGSGRWTRLAEIDADEGIPISLLPDIPISRVKYGIVAGQNVPRSNETALNIAYTNDNTAERHSADNVITAVADADGTTYNRFSLSSGVYLFETYFIINEHGGAEDRDAYDIGIEPSLSMQTSIGYVRNNAATQRGILSVQSVVITSTTEIRITVKSHNATSGNRTTLAADSYISIMRLGSDADGSSLSQSPGFSRNTSQQLFFQTQASATATAPATPTLFGYNDDAGWIEYNPWSFERPEAIPTGHVLWVMSATARYYGNQWNVRVNSKTLLIDGFNVRWSDRDDNTNVSYTYDANTHEYESHIQPDGSWGPWNKIGNPLEWTQIYLHTTSFDVGLDTTAFFDLSDWTEIQFRLTTNGISGQLYQRYVSQPIPTAFYGELALNSERAHGRTNLNNITERTMSVTRWLVGDSNQLVNNILLGWDEGPTLTWNRYNGIELGFAMRRATSATSESREVRGMSFRPRGGAHADTPVTFAIYGR